MATRKGTSLEVTAFLQAAGLVAYCSVVAFFLNNVPRWFGRTPEYFAPLLFLLLFTTSALICGIITLYKPFLLWQEKQPKQAVKLVIYTALWLVVFILLVIFLLSTLR